MKILICSLLIYSFTIVSAFAANPEKEYINTLMQVYSDMVFIPEEGEYSGLQIIILPYNSYYKNFKEKILWRSGSGYLEIPLLLDGALNNNKIKVTVPDGAQEHGDWELIMQGDELLAQGPRGLRHDLKKIFPKQ